MRQDLSDLPQAMPQSRRFFLPLRWTLRNRIGASYLTIVLMAAFAASIAFLNMRELQQAFEVFQRAAGQSQRMQRLNADFMRLQVLARDQLTKPTAQRGDDLDKIKGRIRDDLKASSDGDPASAQNMAGAAATYAHFETGLDDLLSRTQEFENILLFEVPKALDAAADSLNKVVVNPDFSERAAVTTTTFRLLRAVRSVQMLLLQHVADLGSSEEAIKYELARADDLKSELRRATGTAPGHGDIDRALTDLGEFKASVANALAFGHQLAALRNDVTRDTAQDMARMTAFLANRAAQQSEQIGAQSAGATRRIVWTTGIFSLLLTLLGIVIALLVARAVTHGLEGMTQTMQRMSRDELVPTIPGLHRHDEIGDMAAAVEIFQDRLKERERLAAASKTEAEGRRDHQIRLDALIEEFRRSIASALSSVAASNTQMQASARHVSTIADDTAERSIETAEASEKASQNVATAMAATSSLADAIGEIARTVAANSGVVSRALAAAEATHAQVDRLSASANRIGSVVNVIRGIAEQTNLLALNATIEAARAGEAGRGFAVVASEVKNLATQTSRATADVGQQIGAMQSSTTEAVEIISQIAAIMREVDAHTALIAAAVQEQEASTDEIARNVQLAAASSDQIAGNIANVRSFANATTQSAGEMMQAATASAQEAHSLHRTVELFLTKVGRA